MTKRLASIDALRGLALIIMVANHCFDWWIAEPYRATLGDSSLDNFIGALVAPTFVTLTGVGMALLVARNRQRGQSFREVAGRGLRRGLFLISMAYVLNFVTFFTGSNWADVFAQDVLHLSGLGVALGSLAAWWLPAPVLLLLAVVWAVISSLYGAAINLPPVVGAWVNGETGTGYFPIMPWLAYIWFGLGVGKLTLSFNRSGTGRPVLNSGWLVLAGCGMLVVMLFTPDIGFRHPRLPFMCFSLVAFFWSWALLQRLDTLSAVTSRLLIGPLALLGKTAFMLYFLHHLIGYRLLYHLGIVNGRSWQGDYGILYPAQAVIGVVIMIALCYVLASRWLPVRDSVQTGFYQALANLIRSQPQINPKPSSLE